jgi:hypothetical protein
MNPDAFATLMIRAKRLQPEAEEYLALLSSLARAVKTKRVLDDDRLESADIEAIPIMVNDAKALLR